MYVTETYLGGGQISTDRTGARSGGPGRAGCFLKSYACAADRSRDAGSDFIAEFRTTGQHFRSTIACVDRGDVRVSRMLDEGGLDMDGQWLPDAIGIAFFWGEGAAIAGTAAHTPRAMLAGIGTGVRIQRRGWSRNYRIGLRRRAFTDLLNDPVTAATVEPWLRRGVRWPQAAAAAEWRLQHAIAEAANFAERAVTTGVTAEAASTALVEDALGAMLELLADANRQNRGAVVASGARGRVVDTALDWLENFPDEPVSVRRLCSQVGASERTLERAFKERFGIGPRGFERERRLRAVHGSILAHGRTRSVTDLAMQYGFWHLGRFSANYAQLFGCTPSETRRRSWRPSDELQRTAPPRRRA